MQVIALSCFPTHRLCFVWFHRENDWHNDHSSRTTRRMWSARSAPFTCVETLPPRGQSSTQIIISPAEQLIAPGHKKHYAHKCVSPLSR
jgi:hypothetical protein